MELEFILPSKGKSVKKYSNPKLLIPAEFLENLITNREISLNNNNNNKSIKKDNVYNRNTNFNKKLSICSNEIDGNNFLFNSKNSIKKTQSLKKDSYKKEKEMLIKENTLLREENQRLRKIIENLSKKQKETNNNNNNHSLKSEDSRNLNKQKLAKLILSLSYEKQSDEFNNTLNFTQPNPNIKLVDDEEKNSLFVNKVNFELGTNTQSEQLNNIFNRTKNILKKYDTAMKKYLLYK